MDRVGGYLAYQELLTDARAHDDVVIVLAAEADVAQIKESRRRSAEAAQRARNERRIR